jgi:hypothetical protein
VRQKEALLFTVAPSRMPANHETRGANRRRSRTGRVP